ncbi:galactosyltransferase-related protein [Amycolatopsis albispora]|uniref:Galactosyltransferase C-terminal domain-containing protein n=1 Tax=Amycolatopsis albispora TaxID=1804986 RepID=A0A344LGX6_9PSEU|nr:galactosyltransferase-related protein [Amycolatopsis albispora]AXB47300.1 hypothetical protein A4R43_36645 [Amycolatopsis albispora]
MSIAVIIPWGTDHGQRERVWTKLRAEWELTGLDLIVAADPLFRRPTNAESGIDRHPFSVGRAINNAARLAPPEYDRFMLWGADQLPDPGAIAWTAELMERHGLDWAFPYNSSAMLSGEDTERYLAGEPVEWVTQTTGCVMPGLMLITRSAFDKVGGFDERYQGWGWEDVDLMNRLCRDVHPYRSEFYSGPLRGLWHDNEGHAFRDDTSEANPNTRLYLDTWVRGR